MYRRKRRRNQGTWLPVLGTIPGSGDRQAHFTLDIAVPSGPNASIFGIIPVTYDAPQENLLNPSFETLGEILSTEYYLKRIVGKLHVAVLDDAAGGATFANLLTDMPWGFLVTAGFFIARAQDHDTGIGDVLPIGGLNYNQYGPQMLEVIREPWIWRRSWLLGSPAKQAAQKGRLAAGVLPADPIMELPPSNGWYGSIQDGPHVDQKTRRRVKQDERLYFAIQARAMSAVQTLTWTPQIIAVGDFRYFASLRKAKNSGNF